MLRAFIGRCGCRVYIPSKPNGYDLKVYALSHEKTCYTFKIKIYVGEQPDGPHKINTSNISLVPKLNEAI